MSLYADGLGQYQHDYDALWQRLVLKSGYAKTRQGELVRLITKLADEYYRNGNINWNKDYRNIARCLEAELCQYFDDAIDQEAIEIYLYQIIRNGETGICYYLNGADEYDNITDYVVRYCLGNTQDMDNTCPTVYDYSL